MNCELALGGLRSIPITEKSCSWGNKRKPRWPATPVTTSAGLKTFIPESVRIIPESVRINESRHSPVPAGLISAPNGRVSFQLRRTSQECERLVRPLAKLASFTPAQAAGLSLAKKAGRSSGGSTQRTTHSPLSLRSSRTTPPIRNSTTV